MDLFEELPYMLGVYRRKLNSAVRMDTRSKAKAAPPYHIYTTSPHNKACLLGQDSTDHSNRRAGEQKLLEAVIRIDLSSADWYVLKETATTDLLFRLLRLDVEKGLEPQAFLAHDMKKKIIAIGAMDVVYRNTRAIIVALEDVQLSREAAMAIKDSTASARTPLTRISVS
ncbi:hypothetical protein HO173_005743 [Letharia columbiana]|uniref:Uncharacterized protein n=1 Tax=Letharia columbiana TaxID=112416 RepID=A0A8H6FWH3_9LECA|nr:uncharacterized protein HO173_005743 [Letharia columbiana]KAF6236115.1 hypothetical protein HO173_005743 [Letharia columbiana]